MNWQDDSYALGPIYDYDTSELTPLWPMNRWQVLVMTTGIVLFQFGWLVWPGRA